MLSILNRRIVPHVRSVATIHSASISYGTHLISNVFNKACSEASTPIKMKELLITRTIILNNCQEAESRLQQKSRLAERDRKIPLDWPVEKKISHAVKLREQFYSRVALTPHPTEILSEEMRQEINNIVKLCLEINQKPRGSSEALLLKEQITELLVTKIIPGSLVAPKPATTDQERERIESIYIAMSEDFLDFQVLDSERFAAMTGENYHVIKQQFYAAQKKSHSGISTWSADCDGNKLRDAEYLKRVVAGPQLAILKHCMSTYLTADLRKKFPKLQHIWLYYERCIDSYEDNILFNQESAKEAKKKTLMVLGEILGSYTLTLSERAHISRFRDFIELVGYRCDLKHSFRQSSEVNEAIFDDFSRILFTECFKLRKELLVKFSTLNDKEKKLFRLYTQMIKLLNERPYHELSLSEKNQFHGLIRTKSKYFKILKDNQHLFEEQTKHQLDMLKVVIQNNDTFNYILSDTKNTNSIIEVIHLSAFAQYLDGILPIDGVRKLMFNLLPLCETERDIENLSTILNDMLNDVYISQCICDFKELAWVPGYSDIGKRLGEFGGHLKMLKAQKSGQDVLTAHQMKDQRFNHVKTSRLYGSGEDSERKSSESLNQLRATAQGTGASKLGKPGGFLSHLEAVVGEDSENDSRINELRILMKEHPEADVVLDEIIKYCVKAYKQYDSDPACQNLFKYLTHPEIAKKTNKSSRAESKSAKPTDIMQSRAIGMAVFGALSLIASRRYMGAQGLLKLTEEQRQQLPTLYRQLTSVQELVEKTIYSIIISDFSYGWEKVLGREPSAEEKKQWSTYFELNFQPKEHYHTLAYLELQAYAILQGLTSFFPKQYQSELQVFLG